MWPGRLRQALCALAFAATTWVSEGRLPPKISSATLNAPGALHPSYSDGGDVRAPKLKGQVGFGHPMVAPDRRTVGWLAMFPNCCTSYPIPLTLVIYRDGKILASIKPGRSIFHWVFLASGSRVALTTDLLHGDSDADYELHDVMGGRLIASWNAKSTKKQPDWVGLLDQDNSNDL